MKTILGVDPGSGKIGLAIVRGVPKSTEILYRKVCGIEELEACLAEVLSTYQVEFAVVGNGTNSKSVQEIFRNVAPGLSILIVDERDTSIRARERYWEHSPRRGLRRLLPSTLQVPPVPIDDFVAAILAERAINIE